MFHSENSKAINVSTVINYLRKLSKEEKLLFSEFVTLAKLILVSLATNAVGERLYSTIRRIKTYLRTTMTQRRLNRPMILNTYKEALQNISLIDIANEFCRENDFTNELLWYI